MKTRLLALVATLALLITCAAFSASAATITPNSDTYTTQSACPCSVCNGAVRSEWTEITSTITADLTAGHYVVPAGVTVGVSGTRTINAKVVILVVGTIEFDSGHLRIGNSSTANVWLLGGGGSFQGGYSPENHYNPCAIGVYSYGTLNIIGNLTFGDPDAEETSSLLGGYLNMVTGGTINMYGGTVYGYNFTSSNTSSHSAVYIRQGVFNLYGGTINGGTAKYGPIDMSYYNAGKTEFNMYGGTVNAGDSCTTGGAFYVKHGVVNLYGGTVNASTTSSNMTYGAAIFIGKSTKNGSADLLGTVNIGSTDASITTTPTINGGKMKVTVTGTGDETVTTHDGKGGAVYLESGSTLNVYKGTINANAQEGFEAVKGGAIYLASSGYVNISGGIINGGKAANGGAIFQNGGELTITGGTVNGGTATNGGAIYAAGGTLTMQSDANNANGGTVNGSIAEKGGAIYLDENASFTMTKGTVNGCNITDETTTVVNGGAIYSVATGATAVQLNGGTVDGGTIARAQNTSKNITALKGRGSAIYMDGGVLNIGGADIVGGRAQEGGCVYVNAGTLNMTAGTMSGGDALGNGGTVFLKSTMNMSSGTLTANPKNTYDYSKGIRIVDGVLNLSGDAHVIGAGGSEGNAIYALTNSSSKTAKVTLAGQAKVSNPSGGWNYNIFMAYYKSNPSKLEVKAGWTGSASVKFGYIHGTTKETGAEYTVGMQFPAKYAAATGDFDGKLHMEVAANRPTIHWDGATGLKASDVQIVAADGITWYKNNAEALAACDNKEDQYIKLFNNALAMNGETVYVDFNGMTVDVSGSGTLKGFDSSAATDGAGTAKAVVTGVTVEPFANVPVSGECFISIPEGNDTTFHIIKPIVESVSLRPGSAGVYYSGKVICDSTLAAYVKTYGVAVALNDMPGNDFRTNSIYTEENKALASAGTFNGVLVNEIMKDEANVDNNSRADTTICADAYVTVVVNGMEMTCVSSKTGDAASMSLNTLVGKINAVYRTLGETQQNAVSEMYCVFKSDMTNGDWRINNIAAGAGDDLVAQDKDGLKILMIGNSLSVDAGRMLTYVFAREGYDNVRVSTLYRSGCRLYQHVDHIEDPSNADYLYDFYDNEYADAEEALANPASLVPSISKKYTMADGIKEDDWDIIVMQQGSSEAALADTYNEDLQTIVDYVLAQDQNKATKPTFIWNSIWGNPFNAEDFEKKDEDDYSKYVTQLKRITGSETADAAAQIKMVDMITQAAKDKILTNENFAYVIPSGTAYIRACAALGNNTVYRDYIHASDLGRLMVSYVWFSAITGKEVTSLPEAIPAKLLRSGTADRAVTDNEKAVLLDCISTAFTDPYTMPTTVTK